MSCYHVQISDYIHIIRIKVSVIPTLKPLVITSECRRINIPGRLRLYLFYSGSSSIYTGLTQFGQNSEFEIAKAMETKRASDNASNSVIESFDNGVCVPLMEKVEDFISPIRKGYQERLHRFISYLAGFFFPLPDIVGSVVFR